MEITLKEKWHESWDVGDNEVINAQIIAEGERDNIFIDYDTDFIHMNKKTGEISLPHSFPDGSLGYLPLKGFKTSDNSGLYSVDIEKLKNSYPDFRMKVYRRPNGKEFELGYSKSGLTLYKELPHAPFSVDENVISYELSGKDVFDFLEVEMRAEIEIEHLAETNPIVYAELSHSSRTNTPQFTCIEFPDIEVDGHPVWFSINPTQLSMVSKLKNADYIAPCSDALHITALLAKDLAFDNERERQSYDESLEFFNKTFLGEPIEAVSYAVYHNSIERRYGEYYSSAIARGLNSLAKLGYDYDGISKMVYSKNNLFRDDPPLMEIAKQHMRSKPFLKLCEASAATKMEAALGAGIQRSI